MKGILAFSINENPSVQSSTIDPLFLNNQWDSGWKDDRRIRDT
jgi:hypothetical protein